MIKTIQTIVKNSAMINFRDMLIGPKKNQRGKNDFKLDFDCGENIITKNW